MSDLEDGEALQRLRREIETMDRAIGQYDYSEPPRLLWEGLKRSDVLIAIDRAALRSPAPSELWVTECPLVGVHEHVFRGPHRFREWEPSSPAPQPDPPVFEMGEDMERIRGVLGRRSQPAVTVRGLARALHALGFDLRTRTTDPVPFAAKSGNRDADAAAILSYLGAQPEAALDEMTAALHETAPRNHNRGEGPQRAICQDPNLHRQRAAAILARLGSSSAPQEKT